MNPGRELDALIAEKLFGLNLTDAFTGEERPITSGVALQYLDRMSGVPNYSTDIAAAWEVVEKIIHPEFVSSWQFDIRVESWPKKYKAKFSNGGGAHIAHEDSAPHAICLAALKALAIKTEP